MDEQQVRVRLIQVVREVLQDDELEVRDDMTGWDSITYINLIVAVERAFSVTFTTREIHRLTSIREFIDLLVTTLGNTGASAGRANA